MSDRSAWLHQMWQPSFRHSAGALGTEFIRAVRRGKLLGWKTGRLGVTVPPVDAGVPGEWVEVGPGATLIGYASSCEIEPDALRQGVVFAAVRIDGADTMTYALIHRRNSDDDLAPGARLEVIFADSAECGSVLPAFQPVGTP